MKRVFCILGLGLLCLAAFAQGIDSEFTGQSCTSIQVGKKASVDGSVITSHTCDGRYRTWMYMEPAQDFAKGALHHVHRNMMHTNFHGDTTGVKTVGSIPEVAHTYAFLNTSYPCLNEKQLAIGETTFSGPDTLVNPNGLFYIEELETVLLQRCDNARDAITLMGKLIKKYGYGDGGECITIADKNEVWQVEILGEGPDKIGGVWAAQRIPDDHVGVSANIPRIGKINRADKDHFMASDNVEKVALKYGLWDGKGDFVFWKAFRSGYGGGKNFHDREFFILNALAPSLHLTRDMDELPFSVKPDEQVDVRRVIELLRSTYDGTDMDQCKNVKIKDDTVSPIANPWMTGTMMNTLNHIAPGTVESRRTVAVAWCAYSHVTQLRDWLPDEVGGVCWISVDNPAQSPRIPVFCGTTRLPEAFDYCGQNEYNANAAVWKFRKANKLATVAWQTTKKGFMENLKSVEDKAFEGLPELEKKVAAGEKDFNAALLNAYTQSVYDNAVATWTKMEEGYWKQFAMGF